MAEIIKAKANKEGKVIVRLYGNDFDLTGKFKNGVAKLRAFGTDYEVQCKESKKVEVKAPKTKEQKVDVGFIETPAKD